MKIGITHQDVRDIHRDINDPLCDRNDRYRGFEVKALKDAWSSLYRPNRHEGLSAKGKPKYLDRDYFHHGHEYKTPLRDFSEAIQRGIYPPPETMIALAEGIKRYEDAYGKMSLEEALIGAKKHRAGNFARRLGSFHRIVFMSATLKLVAKRDGVTLAEAAEKLAFDAQECGADKVDADTILRYARKFKADK